MGWGSAEMLNDGMGRETVIRGVCELGMQLWGKLTFINRDFSALLCTAASRLGAQSD